MIATDVTVHTCDHCAERRKVCRLAIIGEENGRLPFLSIWLCGNCLRKIATFCDSVGLKPAG